MSPTKQKHRSSPSDAATTTTSTVPDWISEAINGGSLRHVDLENGTNGWSSPPGNLFSLRSKNYFNKKQKSPAGEYLLTPVGMDWLKSTTKLDNVLGHRDNRVAQALRKAQSEGKSLKSFVFAVNLQVPGKDQHSAVFYFAAADPIPPGSLLHKFLHGDDAYRNQRFKIVNRIVKGPWVVRKTVGNYSADSARGVGMRDEREDRYGVRGGGPGGGRVAGEINRGGEGVSDGNVVGRSGGNRGWVADGGRAWDRVGEGQSP
ncbi:Protein ENHANCED DISEASE RESISTANCE 2-like [Linum grandiflorum]